ncbi:MAG: DUF1385 domain-containing protein [Clostridia bacterium]|nr:DUF1385 domain-containing protein [Clostridia bacterium]
MKKNNKNKTDVQNNGPSCGRLGSVGGQAVIEGVMMKSREHYAIAVRQLDGNIAVEKFPFKSIREKYKVFKLPILRGISGFIETLKLSFSTLTKSTEMLGLEEEGEPSKFENWLDKKFGKSIFSFISAVATVFGIVLSLLLFMYLPALASKGINAIIEAVSDNKLSHLGFTAIEGVIKIIIFITYIGLTALIPDIKRVYQYHGAEHKSIFCYESGEELTVENVKKQIRFHPRCGTSFIFVILILSIVVMTLVSEFVIPDAWTEVLWSRVLVKLCLLPLVIGLGYEYIMYAGKHDNRITKIFSAPGLWMQRITTREPDDSMMEVAIVSLKTSLPDVFKDYVYENPVREETETEQEENTENAADEDSTDKE